MTVSYKRSDASVICNKPKRKQAFVFICLNTKTNGQVLWHNVTKIYHQNLETSPKMLHLCFSIYSHIVVYMWTCLRVEQPHHWAHCKQNYYSYYSLPGNRNHTDRTVLHGDLHAKQQFMHLPDPEIKTVEDADVCEGSALWQRSKMLYYIRTLRNLAKSQ